MKVKKGKSVPLQTRGTQRVPGNLRFPDYVPMAQDDGKVVSLKHRPPLPPGNNLYRYASLNDGDKL